MKRRQAAGNRRQLVVGQATGDRQQATGNRRQLVVGQATGDRQQATGNRRQLVVGQAKPAERYYLYTVRKFKGYTPLSA